MTKLGLSLPAGSRAARDPATRFDVNPNTGEPLNAHRRLVVATNTIYRDAAHPSHVVLPLVK